MDIQARILPIIETDADTIIVYLFENNDQLPQATAEINHALNNLIQELITAGDITGKANQTTVLYPHGAIKSKRVIVVGLGQKDQFNTETLRRAAATGAKKARDLKSQHAAIALIDNTNLTISDSAQAIAEGALLSLYSYHGQKTKDVPDLFPKTLTILISNTNALSEAQQSVKRGVALTEGACLARDLVNLPPNICTPTYMASQARQIAETLGLKCEILEEQQMRTLKMGALLGVTQGSDTPPRFIILEYNADQAAKLDTVVLIGKGITFDTGGYNLKPSDSMFGMKADMSGGAAVIGAMCAIAKLGIPLHVIGLIPAVDNMISGHAYRPQEVLTASNGKTIEITSTDAEGRLLLADALVYAKRYNPAAVIDIATLTGACVVALGSAAAGLFSTDDTLRDILIAAANATGERLWSLPLFPEYEKPLESQTADMKNSAGGRNSGVGISAMFLKNFVDFPAWAHIDMAGMAGIDSLAANPADNPYLPATGATGYGARLLAEFTQQWANRK